MNSTRLHRASAIAAIVGAFILLVSPRAAAQTGSRGESYVLPWPADAGWHQVSKHEFNGILTIDYANGAPGQAATETGSIFRASQVQSNGVVLRNAVDASFRRLRTQCSSARMSILDEDSSGAHPWIIYTTTCPNAAAGRPETNVYQMIRGEMGIYICQRTLAVATLSDEMKQQMIAFFKGGTFVREN